jgi:predicted nucleic acid-binding protein
MKRARSTSAKPTEAVWGLILVTSDKAFRRIKKLEVEDWTKP